MPTVLHDDALAVLAGWKATSGEADLAREQTLELLAAGPVAMTRAHRPGHVTASALVVGADRRILLCLHGRLRMWMQLGGTASRRTLRWPRPLCARPPRSPASPV